MKAWSFKVMCKPGEVREKLESRFKDVDGFAFNLNRDKNDSATFKIHKRALEVFQIAIRNNIIVKGKILKTTIEDETKMEISFAQHLLVKLAIVVYILLGVGLVALLIQKSSSPYIFIVGGVLLIGILVGIDVQKKFVKNVQSYKNLISEILKA